jgi:alkylation response protein AidB-like acyl-CoA dehydrogenase
MDFALDEQQEMLGRSARDFLNKEYSDRLLKELAIDEKSHDLDLWNKMSELGWMGLSIPEEYGGYGSFVDLIILIKEMGRAGLISPFFSTLILGAQLITAAGNAAQKQKYLPAVVDGKLVLTLALLESSVKYSPEGIKIKATPGKEGFTIVGTKFFVPEAHVVDVIFIVAKTKESTVPGEGITLFLLDRDTPGVSIQLLHSIAGDKKCQVNLNKVNVSEGNVIGEIDGGWPYIEAVLAKAAIGACADMIGAASRVLDFTITYAKDRTAFGHPIGAFQSIQHRCADMLMDLETSKLATYKAAWLLNEDLPSVKEVAIAKAWVSQAVRRIVTSSHQIHGPIGFTEDHILHMYTRRVKTQGISFGDSDYHLSTLVNV